jgi:glycosyltransferase involved in cell wall biosynthesis
MYLDQIRRFQEGVADLEGANTATVRAPVGEPHRILFAYWGRRGALSRLTLDLTRIACTSQDLRPLVSISRQNELFSEFAPFGAHVLPVDTFTYHLGAANLVRLVRLRRNLAKAIEAGGIKTVIMMMPHVWGPAVMPMLHQTGCRYVLVVHDAVPHPGDRSAVLNAWMLRDAAHAHSVVTLSKTVARRLAATGMVSPHKLVDLFHPDLTYGDPFTPSFPRSGEPFKFLFFGRILPYKGLPLFVDAAERLRREGVPIQVGVFGEGDLQPLAGRLRDLDAEVVNRWIPDREVVRVFARHHAVVVAHTEASQSGVVASAHGLGLPVVATSVGALHEQIEDEVTGLLAATADASCLAAAMKRLALDPDLYDRIVAGIAATRGQRSMERFLSELVTRACLGLR